MSKIAVIGAGQVGSAIAYTLTFSAAAQEIVLIDINRSKAHGEALDISHAAAALSPVAVYSGDWDALYHADIIIVTAGVNQEVGENRRDLAQRNLDITSDICREIAARENNSILMLVTNPVDVITHAAVYGSGLPAHKVIGSGTVLDTMRFRRMLAEHTCIDSRNIHAYVLGEHGDSELPAWSATNIAGMDIQHYCKNCGGCRHTAAEQLRREFDEKVRCAAYSIIEGKGATNYGIATAVYRLCRAVLRDEHAIFTVSTLLNGQYGLQDVCLSLPCVIGKNGIERVLELPLSSEEILMLRHSADVIRSVTPAAKKNTQYATQLF